MNITRENMGLSENVVPLNLIVNHNFLLKHLGVNPMFSGPQPSIQVLIAYGNPMCIPTVTPNEG